MKFHYYPDTQRYYGNPANSFKINKTKFQGIKINFRSELKLSYGEGVGLVSSVESIDFVIFKSTPSHFASFGFVNI